MREPDRSKWALGGLLRWLLFLPNPTVSSLWGVALLIIFPQAFSRAAFCRSGPRGMWPTTTGLGCYSVSPRPLTLFSRYYFDLVFKVWRWETVESKLELPPKDTEYHTTAVSCSVLAEQVKVNTSSFSAFSAKYLLLNPWGELWCVVNLAGWSDRSWGCASCWLMKRAWACLFPDRWACASTERVRHLSRPVWSNSLTSAAGLVWWHTLESFLVFHPSLTLLPLSLMLSPLPPSLPSRGLG